MKKSLDILRKRIFLLFLCVIIVIIILSCGLTRNSNANTIYDLCELAQFSQVQIDQKYSGIQKNSMLKEYNITDSGTVLQYFQADESTIFFVRVANEDLFLKSDYSFAGQKLQDTKESFDNNDNFVLMYKIKEYIDPRGLAFNGPPNGGTFIYGDKRYANCFLYVTFDTEMKAKYMYYYLDSDSLGSSFEALEAEGELILISDQ